MSDVIFNDIGYLGALRAEASAAPNKALEESPLSLRLCLFSK